MSSIAPKPNFSSNYDPEQGVKDLEPLLRGNGGKWSLTESGKGVERWFKFKTFKKTWVGACYTSTRDGAHG
jgi:4a-hydroxytetrahydrobiopterin dehydratase